MSVTRVSTRSSTPCRRYGSCRGRGPMTWSSSSSPPSIASRGRSSSARTTVVRTVTSSPSAHGPAAGARCSTAPTSSRIGSRPAAGAGRPRSGTGASASCSWMASAARRFAGRLRTTHAGWDTTRTHRAAACAFRPGTCRRSRTPARCGSSCGRGARAASGTGSPRWSRSRSWTVRAARWRWPMTPAIRWGPARGSSCWGRSSSWSFRPRSRATSWIAARVRCCCKSTATLPAGRSAPRSYRAWWSSAAAETGPRSPTCAWRTWCCAAAIARRSCRLTRTGHPRDRRRGKAPVRRRRPCTFPAPSGSRWWDARSRPPVCTASTSRAPTARSRWPTAGCTTSATPACRPTRPG